jgi:hypothetical protein
LESERELIVMVKPEAGLRATMEGVAVAEDVDVTPLADLLSAEGINLEPLFGESEERLMYEAEALAPTTDEVVPELQVFYRVPADDDRLDELADRLIQQEMIQAAYVKAPPEPAALPQEAGPVLNEMPSLAEDAPPATADFTPRQDYLDRAPIGIDAEYAWTMAGGRGTGIGIIDIEGAWRFSHEDLRQSQGGVIGGTQSTDLGWRNHGTAVAGEFGGDRNTFGVTGICPEAITRAVSIFPTSTMGTARAIRHAANASKVGDIILIELQRTGPRGRYLPVEFWPDDFAAIRYAISKGIVVVEAGGNGGENLDDPFYNNRPTGFPNTWQNPFDLTNPSSGAVMVGAGNPPKGTHGRNQHPTHNEPYVDRARCFFSNYGARIDCQGWGWEVTTCGYGDLQGGSNEDYWYTDQFSGTSSASPIVVGALGCVQGILRAQGAPPLTSARARSLLRASGSPQQDAPGRPRTQRIGNRPNLRQLIPLATKVWHNNKKLRHVYAVHSTQAAWAFVETVGWRRLKPSSADGVTNLFFACCEAAANSVNVHVEVDQSYLYRIVLA